MKIYVITSTGTIVTLEVERSDNIDSVKSKIWDKVGTPKNKQFLFFVRQQLKEGQTLADYGISNETTLFLVKLKLTQAGTLSTCFVDLENNDALQRIAVTYRPGQEWSKVTSGLNIEGRCTKLSCTAYAKRVIALKGFCAFDITTERSTCPGCERIIEASTCGLTDCEWMYSGHKRGSAVEITSEWQVAGDEYERFREAGNVADWEVLIITARPKRSRRPECEMCLTSMLREQDHESLECGCQFHRHCVLSWKYYETHCPTCRVEICSPNTSVEGREATPDISLEGREN